MTDPPTKPSRTWLPMTLWTAGILLALGLAWFVGAVVLPVWRVRKILEEEPDPGKVVERLGGAGPAIRALRLYAKLPDRVAPSGDGAVFSLGWCGPEAMPALVAALGSPRTQIAGSAAHALADGPFFEERTMALPSLIEIMKRRSDPGQFHAARAIGNMGPRAKAAVPALSGALANPEGGVAAATAVALGAIGPDAAPSVPALRKALHHSSQNVRRRAVIALGAIGPGAKEALPDVLELLAGPDQVLRADAVLAVAGITREGDMVKRAYAVIAGRGSAPDSLYLYEMAEEMKGLGDGAAALAPLMEKLLADKDGDVRAYASRILRRIPGHEDAPAIPFPHGNAPAY